MKYEVLVATNKKLRGFHYDKNHWIKRRRIEAKNVDKVISIINKRYGIKEEDMTCVEILRDENYATYDSDINGMKYYVDINESTTHPKGRGLHVLVEKAKLLIEKEEV